MHLGPERTAAFIRQVLAERSYVVCHDTLTYGDFPGYGPAICRGFFDAYRNRTPALLILQAGRRLTEVPPPLVARAGQLGRDAGKAAASRVPGGNTPEDECRRMLHVITGGDPAVPGASEPPASRQRPALQPDTARTTSPATLASSPATVPCPAPCPPTPTPSGRKPSGPPASTPPSTSRVRLRVTGVPGLPGTPGDQALIARPAESRKHKEKHTAIRRSGGKAI
jgi:hypothetical protein